MKLQGRSLEKSALLGDSVRGYPLKSVDVTKMMICLEENLAHLYLTMFPPEQGSH